MSLINLLFNFNGRINRAQYWSSTLGVSAVSVMISMLVAAATGSAAMKGDPSAALSASLGALSFVMIANVLTFWCSLAIQVKRFHDRGRSGWLAAVPFALLIWMIASIVGSAMNGQNAIQALSGLGLPMLLFILCGFAFFIDLGCLPSKPGPNKYGNPPGAPSAPGPQFSPKGGAPAPSTLGNAESALERAIAQRKAPAAANAGSRPAAAAPVRAVAPAAGRPAAPASFGRRTTS